MGQGETTRAACQSLSAEGCEGLRFLVYGGHSGWIGQLLVQLISDQAQKCEVVIAKSRMEDRAAVYNELQKVAPTNVLCAAGVTGRPNVDWCEDHRKETIRSNVTGTLTLCDVCDELNIHLTLFATGCIYSYDAKHPLGSGKGFTEMDPPNFDGSFYSKTKGLVEHLIQPFLDNTLVLRVRMPLCDDMNAPRNFIYKIARYERVVNIPNSMTSLPDMLPVAVLMASRGLTGIYNFTNPGTISHNECLELYREYIDPEFTWKNFTEEEQALVLKAPRSNNMLDTTKLVSALPDIIIPDILTATKNLFMKARANMENSSLKGNQSLSPTRPAAPIVSTTALCHEVNQTQVVSTTAHAETCNS